MFGMGKPDGLSQWCRFPNRHCTCSQQGGVGYMRLREQERLDDDASLFEEDDLGGHGKRLIFHNENGSPQAVVVEENLCASDLCQLLAVKNRVAKSVNWGIIEQWEDSGLERTLEDHEYVLKAYRDMKNYSHHTRVKYLFRKDYRKYEFFHHPHQFFPSDMMEIEGEQDETPIMNPHILQNLLAEDGQCPVIFSQVWIKDIPRKTWTKSYMLLRDQRLYVSAKVSAIAKLVRAPKSRVLAMISENNGNRDIFLFANVSDFHVYRTLNAKKHFSSPTEWGFVLRPSADITDDEQTDHVRCLACDSERVRSCWLTAMRLAKYGKQLRENYRAFRNKQAESINPKDYNSYSVPNESVRSRVAMDFTGSVGRIVEDPLEASAIAVAEGYSWKRRWRPSSRGGGLSSLSLSSATVQSSLEGGVHVAQPWFHGGMTRDQATSLVSRHGTVDGVFLVRDSRSNPGSFVLTYKCGGKVIHAQINAILDPLRDRPVFSLDSGSTKFYDILQLIEFYQLNAGSLPTRLTHYVVQNSIVPLANAPQRQAERQAEQQAEQQASSSNLKQQASTSTLNTSAGSSSN